jgi:transcriptional regulator with XRE-family HTH domain
LRATPACSADLCLLVGLPLLERLSWIHKIQCWRDTRVCEKILLIMPIRDRLREIREQENSVRKDVRRGSGLIRWYVSRVEDGRAVPAIETLEKMARAMGMPLYQLFCEGEEPPKLALRTKRKSADEIGWANSGKDDTFLIKFQKLLPRMNKDDRDLLFYVAQKMASPRREAATESSQAAQKRLISLYHRLVDKQIGGTASAKELAQLQSIEGMMQAIEHAQTFRIDEVLEQQHRAIIERLTALIAELRRTGHASGPTPIATQ